jgi:arsenite methyltransferase
MNGAAFERLALLPGDRVLEVGFGSGYLLEQILASGSCAYAAGVDPSAEMVRVAARRLEKYIRDGKADLRQGSAEALPHGAGEFTKLCTVNTVYFWRDAHAALVECRRVLKSGGLIVLCFNAKEDLQRWPGHKHGFRLYELAEIEDALTRARFGAIEVAGERDPRQGLFYCVSARAVE